MKESDRKYVKATVALLSSIIASGESHSDTSKEAVKRSLDILNNQDDVIPSIISAKRRSTCPQCQSKRIEDMGLYTKCNDCGKDWVD